MKRFEFFVFFFESRHQQRKCAMHRIQNAGLSHAEVFARRRAHLKNKQTMETKGNTRKHATTQKKASSLGILYQRVIMSCNKM